MNHDSGRATYACGGFNLDIGGIPVGVPLGTGCQFPDGFEVKPGTIHGGLEELAVLRDDGGELHAVPWMELGVPDHPALPAPRLKSVIAAEADAVPAIELLAWLGVLHEGELAGQREFIASTRARVERVAADLAEALKGGAA